MHMYMYSSIELQLQSLTPVLLSTACHVAVNNAQDLRSSSDLRQDVLLH